MSKAFHQPDESALRRCLEQHPCDSCGIAVRLAWLAGLMRNEIYDLTWEQLDFKKSEIHLPKRTVPMASELSECLRRWRKASDASNAHVMVSPKSGTHIAPQSISRMAGAVLQESGQPEVDLTDLRYDFLRRCIAEQGWQYALRVTGFSVTTYRNELCRLFESPSPAEATEAEIKEYQLWKVLQNNREGPVGIALWLSWQMDMALTEIVSLTWEQVDFNRRLVVLPERTVPLSIACGSILEAELTQRSVSDDPHAILTPKTRRPMDVARLSTLVRTVLVREGIDAGSIGVMRMGVSTQRMKEALMRHAREKGCVKRREALKMLDCSDKVVYRLLDELVEDGHLTHISSGYYPTDQIVPPEQQERAVLDYIASQRVAYCGDISTLLHIEKRPTQALLSSLVREGKLRLDRGSRQYRIEEN